MKPTIVIFKSKYGATQGYAKAIANAKGRVDFYDEASIDHLVEYVKNI